LDLLQVLLVVGGVFARAQQLAQRRIPVLIVLRLEQEFHPEGTAWQHGRGTRHEPLRWQREACVLGRHDAPGGKVDSRDDARERNRLARAAQSLMHPRLLGPRTISGG
jgi:hypothetical protein